MKKIIYITGSFPNLGDGIGDAAGRLYHEMCKNHDVLLITSDVSSIQSYIKRNNYTNVILIPDWKFSSISFLINKIKKERIEKVLIEYAGNGYKKDLAISFLPLRLRIHNLFSKRKIECHLRLHEYTMCRTARKIFTIPLILFCHHLDTPSYIEYIHLQKKFGKKVNKSAIGSNINWRTEKKFFKKKGYEKIRLAFFGGIYPGKGIEKLIEIWSELEKLYPGKYEYQLLGGFPKELTNAFNSYQKHILDLIKKQGLQEKIIISGFLPEEELEKLLDQVDIAVLPYEDGLTLRRGSFLAFLGRNVAIVTSQGDEEASVLFRDASGVRMCADKDEMIQAISDYSENAKYYEAGLTNAQFQKTFNWSQIAEKVLSCFEE